MGPISPQRLWDAVVASNRAWREGRPREVGGLFHEDAVALVGPGRRLVGRNAIVQSYVDYCASVKTHVFAEQTHSVEVFGDTAVVQYRFSVRYELGGQVHDEVGQEILVFVPRAGEWRAVWRTQTPAAS
jgi:uncharacterized protein (TIGR02246 family)